MGLSTTAGSFRSPPFPPVAANIHEETLAFNRMNRTVDYRFMDENLSFWPIQRYRTRTQVRVPAFALQQSSVDDTTSVVRDNLSSSSQLLLSRYEQLSAQEKSRFHQKVQAEAKASQPLLPAHCLHVLYVDEHMCVTVKPSGILSVPGPRQNPSLAQLVYQQFPPPNDDDMTLDQTVVHRLDMDTSGILVFARSKQALQQLQADFRPQDTGDNLRKQQQQQHPTHHQQPRRIHKIYHALVEGHVPFEQGEMDVALERDPTNPPFMRVAQPKPSLDDPLSIGSSNSANYPSLPRKWLEQAPKPSWTEYQVLSHEHFLDASRPVTRLVLTPHTGRTHQLRVHCAQVLHHAIVGDEIYGGDYKDEESFVTRTTCTPKDGSDDDDELPNLERRKTTQTITLCLHAFELRLHHPITRAPMIFQAQAPF